MAHPCELAPDIPECVALAEKLAAKAEAEVATGITEVLKANAPAVMERLNAAVAHIGEWVETGEVFATEQVPLLVKEIVFWGVADGAFWVLLGLGLLSVCCICWYKTISRANAWLELHTDRYQALRDAGHRPEITIYQIIRFAFPIGGSVVGFFGFMFFVCNIMDMIKPLVTPRLYLIEYFQHLVR